MGFEDAYNVLLGEKERVVVNIGLNEPPVCSIVCCSRHTHTPMQSMVF